MRKTGKMLICNLCENPFYAAKWEIKHGRKFCGRKCYEKNWAIRIPGWNKGKKRWWNSPTEFTSERVRGDKNGMWKGDNVGYAGLHKWVYLKLGKPIKCEKCSNKKNLQWANKSWTYKRNILDWLSLCYKCHR